jgi:hypothetical protein
MEESNTEIEQLHQLLNECLQANVSFEEDIAAEAGKLSNEIDAAFTPVHISVKSPLPSNNDLKYADTLPARCHSPNC